MENNLKGSIYCLQNPITKEIFYIGATKTKLIERLKKHYWDLDNYKKGKRKKNKRFEYLKNLLPTTVNIGLVELVDIKELDNREKYWIQHYRNLNPNLTNSTVGGKGGDTYSFQSDEKKKEISNKISKSHKGKTKPKGFAENLSVTRQGTNNPNAKEISIGWIVCDKTHLFKYGFEINSFMDNKYAYGNIFKGFKTKSIVTSNFKSFELFSDLKKEIQDIVQLSYESKTY